MCRPQSPIEEARNEKGKRKAHPLPFFETRKEQAFPGFVFLPPLFFGFLSHPTNRIHI
jgi:hypothetical protein